MSNYLVLGSLVFFDANGQTQSVEPYRHLFDANDDTTALEVAERYREERKNLLKQRGIEAMISFTDLFEISRRIQLPGEDIPF